MQYLTVTEACATLEISRNQFEYLLKSGLLKIDFERAGIMRLIELRDLRKIKAALGRVRTKN